MESNSVQNQKTTQVSSIMQQQNSSPYSKITLRIVYNELIYNWNINFMDLNFNNAIVNNLFGFILVILKFFKKL